MPPRADHPVPALQVLVLQEAADSCLVVLAGELDIATGPLLHERLEHVLADPATSRVVFDLGDLEFADVVGLTELLRIERRLASGGCRVLLRRPPPLVRRVLALLGLHQRLPVEDERQAGREPWGQL